MNTRTQISIDHDIYDLLQELRVPPADLNDVLRDLLFITGKVKSHAVNDFVTQSKTRTFAEEIKAVEDGVYSGSGCFP